MKLLAELKDNNLENTKLLKYKIRKAARAIIFHKGKIPLLFVSKHNYHKLPGGGLKPNESIKKGLDRELLEETGCSANIEKEIGKIIEYKNRIKQKNISYCFLGKIYNINKKLNFTNKEKSEGFKLKWVTLSTAINLLKKDKPKNYEGKQFINKRDLIFLLKAKEILK